MKEIFDISYNEHDDLKAAIVEAIIGSEDRDGLATTHYTPSSMICTRNMYYKRVGKKTSSKRSANLVRINESGTDAHERIQNKLKLLKTLDKCNFEYIDVEKYVKDNKLELEVVKRCGNEVKLYSKKYNIMFLCDGVIYNKKLNKYYILEIKTEVMSTYWKHTKKGEQYIHDKHIPQAAAYSMLFKIPNVVFYYEGRDFCDFELIFKTISDEDIEQVVMNKINIVEHAISNKQLPEKDINSLFENTCKFCEYKLYCKKDTL